MGYIFQAVLDEQHSELGCSFNSCEGQGWAVSIENLFFGCCFFKCKILCCDPRGVDGLCSYAAQGRHVPMPQIIQM